MSAVLQVTNKKHQHWHHFLQCLYLSFPNFQKPTSHHGRSITQATWRMHQCIVGIGWRWMNEVLLMEKNSSPVEVGSWNPPIICKSFYVFSGGCLGFLNHQQYHQLQLASFGTPFFLKPWSLIPSHHHRNGTRYARPRLAYLKIEWQRGTKMRLGQSWNENK